MKIVRYDWCESGMLIDSTGSYVSHDDYEQLTTDYTELQIKYDNLVKQIGDIYHEA